MKVLFYLQPIKGPTLPAFLSPNVAKVLVDNFGIGGITNVEDDMKMFMGA